MTMNTHVQVIISVLPLYIFKLNINVRLRISSYLISHISIQTFTYTIYIRNITDTYTFFPWGTVHICV